MRKEEFMRQLEALLSDISEEERREALSYYRNYFEDAGEENEERILRELESPEKVAATIKADLRMEQGDNTSAYTEQKTEAGMYTERGFFDERFQEHKQAVDIQKGMDQSHDTSWEKKHSEEDENRTIKMVLIIVAVVLTSPVWGSLLAGIFSIIVGIIATVFGIMVAAFSLYVAGGIMFGIGIGEFIVGSVAVGFGLLGAAMLVWVVAILMTVFSVWVCGKGIPWFGHAVGKLWKKIFPGKGQAV